VSHVLMKLTIRRHIGSSFPSFFFHLSSSHWRGYEAWTTSHLGHRKLSKWKGSYPLMDCHLSSSYWRVFEKLARQVIF